MTCVLAVYLPVSRSAGDMLMIKPVALRPNNFFEDDP